MPRVVPLLAALAALLVFASSASRRGRALGWHQGRPAPALRDRSDRRQAGSEQHQQRHACRRREAEGRRLHRPRAPGPDLPGRHRAAGRRHPPASRRAG